MKNILKNDKGINLVSLAIAIVILVIVTTMLVYNAKDSVYIKSLTNMYIDIGTLREKISDYYRNYEQVPANIKYENTSKIKELKQAKVLGANDDEDLFYIIDLQAIENLTLNYGEDYSKISKTIMTYNGNLSDLYIINKNSHNIFYIDGVEVPEDNGMIKIYYTDDENVDTKKVDLRYIDGVKIPDGYTYVKGNKEDGITISKDGKEYIWQVLDQKITSISDISGTIDLKGNSEEEFLESANAYEGYYKLKNGNEVVYTKLEEEWSEAYDVRGTFVDEDENKVYIPQGFQISRKLGENRVNDGLVIRNAETKDEYVWIKVPQSAIGVTAVSEIDYDNIEKDLQNYVKDYRKDGYIDEWYEGCGLTPQEYINLKHKMLGSIYTNGGFYIGRYEAGLENPKTGGNASDTVNELIEKNGIPLSQKDKYPYIYITCLQSQQLANKLSKDNYTTSLMFGIQWDLVCKFIEATESKTKSEILINNRDWGNFNDSEFTTTQGKYTSNPSQEGLWMNALSYTKTASSILFTTGATKRNSVLNIYDLAGNEWEWTLEHKTSDNPCIYRGACYHDSSASYNVNFRGVFGTTTSVGGDIGFRIALYE